MKFRNILIFIIVILFFTILFVSCGDITVDNGISSEETESNSGESSVELTEPSSQSELSSEDSSEESGSSAKEDESSESSQNEFSDGSNSQEESNTKNESSDEESKSDPAESSEPLPTYDKVVALTFDDGPNGKTTERLLDILKKYDAKCTFFVVGNRIDYYPKTIIRIFDEGHTIGNHSYTHRDLRTLSESEIQSEIEQTNEKISALVDYIPKLMRPPYGSIKSGTKTLHGLRVVFWSIDSLDWKVRNAEIAAENILKSVKSGDIILLHDLYETSVDAAEIVLKELTEQGYKFVTVETLLALR